MKERENDVFYFPSPKNSGMDFSAFPKNLTTEINVSTRPEEDFHNILTERVNRAGIFLPAMDLDQNAWAQKTCPPFYEGCLPPLPVTGGPVAERPLCDSEQDQCCSTVHADSLGLLASRLANSLDVIGALNRNPCIS